MTFFNSFIEILIISTPLLLISLGTLFSELCGILAVFCDGIINLSAFLFFLLYNALTKLALLAEIYKICLQKIVHLQISVYI